MPLSPGLSLATSPTCRTVHGLSPAGGGRGWLWQRCSNQGLCLLPRGQEVTRWHLLARGSPCPWRKGRMAREGRGHCSSLVLLAGKQGVGNSSSPPLAPILRGERAVVTHIMRQGAHLAPQLSKAVWAPGKEPQIHAHLCNPWCWGAAGPPGSPCSPSPLGHSSHHSFSPSPRRRGGGEARAASHRALSQSGLRPRPFPLPPAFSPLPPLATTRSRVPRGCAGTFPRRGDAASSPSSPPGKQAPFSSQPAVQTPGFARSKWRRFPP